MGLCVRFVVDGLRRVMRVEFGVGWKVGKRGGRSGNVECYCEGWGGKVRKFQAKSGANPCVRIVEIGDLAREGIIAHRDESSR